MAVRVPFVLANHLYPVILKKGIFALFRPLDKRHHLKLNLNPNQEESGALSVIHLGGFGFKRF